ncbi:acyl-CoA dehydrogenase [Amycolatopsis sp. NPDC101161]|uniref:acyl-CoA dehydrogenase n=1 Tax=Amycolatopsis sp. NPDC101161 TaxID=3363940 RepID=UPI00380299C7
MSYIAPVQEYSFLLRHAFDGDKHLADASGGELTVDDAETILGAAAEFAVDVLHPLNAAGDRAGARLENGRVITAPGFAEALQQFATAGWIGFAAPASAGGDDTPRLLSSAVEELWAAANPAFALCPGLTLGAIAALDAAADAQQRDTYLAPMVQGRWTGTMNLTEPQAGTDLAAIRTTAHPAEDGTWRVTGQKIFITWGDHEIAENIVHLVLARTTDAPAGLGGLSLFIVPKYLPAADGSVGERNAVTTVSLEHKLGIHASPTCVLDYTDATGFLLGELHHGLAGMFVMMNISRLGIGVQGLGVADRAYQQARDYAAERVQGTVLGAPAGTPISGHPDVARLLTSAASTITAMRGLLLLASAFHDQAMAGDRPAAARAEFLSPVVKGWLTEEALRITSDAIQVHGGAGFIEETGAAQHYRDARISPIYEGTTAIQANDLVGRKVIRDQGRTANDLLDLIDADTTTLSTVEHPAAHRAAQRLRHATDTVRRATSTLVGFAEDNPRDAFAGSVGYLTMWGLLAGGWAHGRIFSAAITTHHAGDLDEAELHRRVVEADFYGAHHLSRIAALAAALEAGEIR